MIINTGPILIAIGAGIFLREGFPPPRPFAGCLVAFGGCLLIGLATVGSGSRIGIGVVVLGWLALGETPPLLAVSGGTLCLAGLLVARRKTASSTPRQGRDQDPALARDDQVERATCQARVCRYASPRRIRTAEMPSRAAV